MQVILKRIYNPDISTQMSCFEMRLRGERERLQLSQHAFGQMGGVEANAQSKYESGQRVPKADYLAAIATIGVNVVFLITGKRAPVSLDNISLDEQKMMIDFRLLQREDQEAISQVTASIALYSDRRVERMNVRLAAETRK